MDLQKIGSDWGGAGVFKPFSATISSAQRVSDAHGRFMDAALAGRLYRTGSSALLAINAATFTVATTGATATPIVGVWNPLTSTVNLVILQAILGVTMTALIATGGGPYAWMASIGNSAISTGLIPFNQRSLAASGSQAKGFAGTALTGMVNPLVVMAGSALFGGSAEAASFTATAASMQTQQLASVENFDGSLIVPPGGVLALMATTTPVAHSVTAGLLWEEVPLMVTV